MTDKDEIITALKILDDYCNTHDSYGCPAKYNGKCMFWKNCYDAMYPVCTKIRLALKELTND